MTATETTHLVSPHGGALVDRTGERPDDLDALKPIPLTSRELSDLDMLASGALSPLEGFMGQNDYESVLEGMRLANGLPWALPVCLAVDGPPVDDRVALADETGRPIAVLEVEGVYDYDKQREAELAYRTTDIPALRGSTSRNRCISPARSRCSSGPLPRFPSLRWIPPRPALRSPSAAGGESWASRPATPSTVRTNT